MAAIRAERTLGVDQDINGQVLGERIAWAERRLHDDDPLNHGANHVFESMASVTEWTSND